jgi:8-oxo-dGTP pyrophosphatase MutT (NUDIX family)
LGIAVNPINHAYFQVSVKAIVKRDDEILLLIFPDGYYDFPGGRMDESEVDLSLHEIMTRELKEELGGDFKFAISNIAFVSKRHFKKSGKDTRILASFFEVDYKSGDITLSHEHSGSMWVKPKSLLKNPEKFVSKDEYEQFKNYCNTKL